MNATLFRVLIQVRPTYAHPHYHDYDLEPSLLLFWLYGRDAQDAADRASAILAQMPYELIGDEAKTSISNEETEDTDYKRAAAAEARQCGLSFLWIAMKAGKAEADGS